MDSYTPDIKLSLGDGFFFIRDPCSLCVFFSGRTGRNVCPTSILVVTLHQLYEFLTINVIRKVRTTGIVAEMPAFDGLSEGETAENLIFKDFSKTKSIYYVWRYHFMELTFFVISW